MPNTAGNGWPFTFHNAVLRRTLVRQSRFQDDVSVLERAAFVCVHTFRGQIATRSESNTHTEKKSERLQNRTHTYNLTNKYTRIMYRCVHAYIPHIHITTQLMTS